MTTAPVTPDLAVSTSAAAAAPGDGAAAALPSGEPRWVAELSAQLVRKVGPFASTATTFVFRPRTFVAEWSRGEGGFMNPLWFAASAAAVVATLQSVVLQFLGAERERSGLVESGLRTLAPYVYYVEIGLAAHLVLRALGSRHRLSSSVAMALYAGGTMASLGQLLVLGILVVSQLAGGPGGDEAPPGAVLALTIALTASFGAFYTVFATTMGALHRVGPLRMLAANGAALLVSSALCDVVPLPTLHVALHVWDHGHFVAPAFQVRSPFG